MDNPTNPAPGPKLKRSKTFMTGYYSEVAPFRVQRPNGIAKWTLCYTVGGRGLFRQPGCSFPAPPGDLVLLEPGAHHDYACAPDAAWEFICMYFMARSHWIPLLGWPVAGRKLRRLSIADAGARERIRDALLRCHKQSCIGTDALSREFALHTLEEVILLAARENTAAPQHVPLSAPVSRVLDHMVEKLRERHTLGSLARIAQMSPSHLAARFKHETGEAVIAYLLKVRLRQAAQMLENSDRRVKEIAEAVGFNDPLYFTRQFHNAYAMSPRLYREKAAMQSRALL